MANKIQIINLALRRLGCEPISSLSENNKRAKVMNDIYELARKDSLEEHPWPFAIKRATLTAEASTPAFEYKYQFKKPTDFLRAISEYNEETYKEEGSKLLADVDTLSLVYIYYNDDEDSYSASFTRSFYLRLAEEGCYSLSQDKSLKDQIQKEREDILAKARSYAAQGSSPQEYDFDFFTDVRL